tara:strand:- start:432 stop:785 length:354 start_codon:yes stop_codon:yes gene_type:complete
MPTQLGYKPLPDNLQISCSPIEGMGIFAKKKIERGTNLGMSHLKLGSRIIRTPLGGFLNHFSNPNCHKVKLIFTNEDDPMIKFDYVIWNLMVIEDIKEGEELTVKYEWYKPRKRVVL